MSHKDELIKANKKLKEENKRLRNIVRRLPMYAAKDDTKPGHYKVNFTEYFLNQIREEQGINLDIGAAMRWTR